MVDNGRFPFVLIALVVLGACKKSSEKTPEGVPEAPTAAAASGPALLDACEIKMVAPEAHEWKTQWDGAHVQTAGANPSGVRSSYWANEQELAIAQKSNTVSAFSLTCGSADSADPSVILRIEQAGTGLKEVPLAPGSYRIVANEGPGKGKPDEFTAHPLLFRKTMFTGKSGTLKLDRFDAEGASGSFVIDGVEMLTGNRPLHVEGTFHMPCRKGLLQGACKSDKAEQPN